MPTLPSAASFGDRPTSEEQLPPVAPQGVQIAGQALAGAAHQAFTSNLQRIQAQNRYDFATGKQQIITGQIAAREALIDDPDWATHEQRYREMTQKANSSVIENTGTPRIKDMLAAYAAAETERGAIMVRHGAMVKRHEEAVGQLSSGLEGLRQAASKAEDEGTRSTILGTANEFIDANISQNFINSAQGQDLKHKFAVNYANDAVEQLPWDEQVKMLSKPGGTPADFLEPGRRADMLRLAQAHLDAEARQAEIQARQQATAQIADFNATAWRGLPSTKPSLALVKTAYPDTWGQVWNEINKTQQFGTDVVAMKTASPPEIDAMRERYTVKAGGVGAADALQRQDAFDRASAYVKAERQKNPVQAAIDAGIYKPLDFSNQNAFVGELSRRLAGSQQVSRQLGVQVPPMSNDEAHAFASALERQRPPDQLGTLVGLRDGLGDDEGFRATMRQLMPHSPVMAIVGSRLASSSPSQTPVWFDPAHAPTKTDGGTILTGESLLNPQGPEAAEREKSGFSKKTFPMPTDAGYNGLRERFSKYVGDTFRNQPDVADSYYAAAKAAYAGLSAKTGDLSGNFNPDRWSKALGIAVGQVIKVGPSQVVVPDGMDSARFPKLVENAIDSTARAAGAPADYHRNISGYGLREVDGVGTGRFMLYSGNAPLTRPGDPRKPFVIDLKGQYTPAAGATGGTEDEARARAVGQGPPTSPSGG